MKSSSPALTSSVGPFRTAWVRIALAGATALAVLAATGCAGKQERTGIVLIVADSLRRDHVSFFGYGRPTSPFLDTLMEKGVVFRNVYSASSQTVPSVASMFTGLYPYRHGSHFFSSNQSYHPTRTIGEGGLPLMKRDNLLLAEVLNKQGFRTVAVSSNPGICDKYGFFQGMKSTHEIDCFRESKAGVCDGMTVNAVFKEKILPAVRGKDFFVYLHYMDVHYPYYKPNAFQARFSERKSGPFFINGPAPGISAAELEYAESCYDEGVVYFDSVIRDLCKILKEAGLERNTLVVLVSDHGDEFLEHGGLGHGTTCYNELLHSFVVFSHPRLAAQAVDRPVSLVDLFPTLVEWAGIEPPLRGDGRSLIRDLQGPQPLPPGNSRILYAELGDRKALVDGDLKFIYNFDIKTAELYDLRTDPAERVNLALRRKAETSLYESKLKSLFNKMAVSYNETYLDEREMQNLKSLGYIR